MNIIPSKIEIEFTDERITASAGSVFLSGMAGKMELPQQLKEAIRLKKRARGATDAEMFLSLIYSLSQGVEILEERETAILEESVPPQKQTKGAVQAYHTRGD